MRWGISRGVRMVRRRKMVIDEDRRGKVMVGDRDVSCDVIVMEIVVDMVEGGEDRDGVDRGKR